MNEKHRMKNGDRKDILSEQWDPSNPKPFSYYSKGSHYRAAWQCLLGHTWKTEVKVRYTGSDCPYCGSRKILIGFNDLATKNPELVREWHPTKNGNLKSNEVMPHSGAKVWWKCAACGNEWCARIGDRSRGKGCPACNGKVPTKNRNLLLMYPEISEEWDYERNVKRPEDYLPRSNDHVWWVCRKCGYTWSAAISSRTNSRKRGCPACAGKVAIPGKTDLATTNPELMAEWDASRNAVSIHDITKGSHETVWWVCPDGHHYLARVANRVYGKGCPQCAKKRRVH